MLRWTSHLEEKLDMLDILLEDASTEIVSIGRPLPLTFCDFVKSVCWIRAERVSQTLRYKNWPLRIDVHKILSRKRNKNYDWWETVDVSLDIRYALCSRWTWQITTPEELLAALEELYGTREEVSDYMVTTTN